MNTQLRWYHAKEHISDMERMVSALVTKSPSSAPITNIPAQNTAWDTYRDARHYDKDAKYHADGKYSDRDAKFNDKESIIRTSSAYSSSPSLAPSRHGSSMLAALAEGWELDAQIYTDRTMNSVDGVMQWADNTVGIRVRMEADPDRVCMYVYESVSWCVYVSCACACACTGLYVS
jgi:hypothetical protein